VPRSAEGTSVVEPGCGPLPSVGWRARQTNEGLPCYAPAESGAPPAGSADAQTRLASARRICAGAPANSVALTGAAQLEGKSERVLPATPPATPTTPLPSRGDQRHT
jgi:hypothetical protein